MKLGFTLIELLITVLVSSIIGTALFTAYSVITRSLTTVDVLIARDTRIGIINYALEHDLYGTCMVSLDTTVTTTTQKKDTQTAQKEEQPKIFASKQDKDGLQSLSFISNNPLPTYHPAGPGPALVQITYNVVPDPYQSGSLSLVRQEVALSASKDAKQPQPKKYTVATGIQNIKLDYFYEDTESGNKGEKKEPQMIKVSQWPPTKEGGQKKNIPPFPGYMHLHLALQEPHESMHTCTLPFEIPVVPPPARMPSQPTEPKKEEAKKEPEKPAQEKKPTPPAPPQQPPAQQPSSSATPPSTTSGIIQELSKLLQETSLKK